MALMQDPRFRQRWNQISHNAETVTENAAAGIWTFQHQYINPCFGMMADAFEGCAGVCIGDRDERARRARESDRSGRRTTRAEYMFDFYDDWDDDLGDDSLGGSGGGSGNILGTWGGGRREDWDRLLAGTGSTRAAGKHAAAGLESVVDRQPRRKRGMSYGTRAPHRKSSLEEDATIIPSTAPLGFLGRLPFKVGGTLRYKPSAANLKDHPGGGAAGQEAENEPLLGTSSDEGDGQPRGSRQPRRRSSTSGTAGSTGTSESFRSRGDLFPSDEEGDEDAIPLDDEFAVELARVDDRSSNKTRSSNGKRPENTGAQEPLHLPTPSLEHLKCEEAEAERQEHEERERKRMAAARLAIELGLARKHDDAVDKDGGLDGADAGANNKAVVDSEAAETKVATVTSDEHFIPARLPYLG